MNRTKSSAVCAWGVKGCCMKRVKSVLSAVPAAVVIVAVLFAASCSYDLLPEPEIEQVQGVAVNKDAQIEAPLTVKATQGKTRVVTISWSTSNGATQYIIYSAASPHEEFLQIAETKGEVNSIDIQAAAGTSAYYRVCARDYKKEISGFSDTVFGSTMATPIISGITSSADGTSATVSWWMENCSASTYQSLVNYVVYCYDESGDEVTSATASGKQTSAVLSGLTANTRYFYQVEAFISADQSNPELSDKVDEETARRLIPDAPENLSATRGTDKTTMAISWTLPPFCDVVVSGGVYERHPLYFTVERKPKGDDDTKYQKIVAYLGTQKASDGASVIQFSCAADGAAINKEGVVSVQPTSDADAERSDNYPNYISCSTITYYDTTAERGVQYEYRVQSYVDDVKKTISAEEAAAVTEGFLLSKPSFSASPYYHKVDGSNAITNITVSFRVVFEPYGQDYNYILCRNYEPMETENGLTGTSVSDHKVTTAGEPTLNGKTDVFDFSAKDFDIGYYQYVLYICASGENDIAKAYDSITMSGKITVIDDASKLPTITRFDIEDGYAGKFRLTWNYDSACRYRLEWTSSLDGFTKVEKLPMDNENFTQENGFATYDHTAQSGERRFYTLVANGGIEVSKTYPLPKDGDAEVPEPQELATLGTAEPRTVDIDYRTISVSWPKVQRATDDFGIKAYYEGTGETALATGTYKIEDRDDDYYCVITNPNGYDDPKRSGLPITMEITAKSDKDTTTAKHTVRTLGPAALDVQTSETPSEDDIIITWKKAEGAEGYLIYRLAYKDRECKEVERTSCYYYEPSEGSKLEVLGDFESDPNVGETRAKVTPSGETYTLKDSYREPTAEDSAYQAMQSKLSWGRPYGYIVLPVKGSDDFTFKEHTAMLAAGSAVDYTANERTFAEVRAATLGYGLNLVADKAMSGTTQKIKWEEPYKAQLPIVYYRAAGSDDKFKKFNGYGTVANGTNTDNLTIDSKDYYDAFEYVVKYYPTDTAYTESEIKEFPPSLLAEIKKNTQTYDTPLGVMTELDNKGYLLTVGGFDAYVHPDTGKGKDYYEQIRWNQWEYDKRAVGPDSMTILVQNNNIDADPHELVSIEKANVSTDASIKAIADDIKAEKEQNTTIRVAPAGIAAGKKGTTDGYLKVLRDYKHNYTFKLQRTVGETPITVSYKDYVGEENSIKTAYRQITAKEFAIVSGISIGDSAYDSSYCSVSESNVGYNRTFVFKDNAKYFLKISGTLYGYATATGKKPTWYGAVCAGSFGSLSGGKSKPTTLTLICDDVPLYKGTVTIDSMRNGGGSYTVNYNNQSEDFRSDVSEYFIYD